MAYTDRGAPPRQRAATAMAVIALEAAVAIAVVQGLTVTFLPRPEEPRVTGEQIDLPPPPPTPPDARHDERRTPELTSDAKAAARDEDVMLFPTGGGDVVIPQGGGEIGTDWGEDLGRRTPPDLPPLVPPRAARPRGDPGQWASAADYPASDLRAGRQGATRFRLAISADGRVSGCEILQSSGSASLDAATCDKVSRRARFDPATDGNGVRVAGSYTGTIRWVIPE